MAMFSEARRGAEDRMKGMGMGEYGEDPAMAAAPADPAAQLMSLIEQVPDPALAEALRAAVQNLVGGEQREEQSEGEPLENDPVVGP